MTTQSPSKYTHPFLRAMVPEHRSILLQGAEEQTFAAGEIVFREGQPANRLYLIHEGRVALETHVPAKGDVVISTVAPGQVLGWSWLVPPFVWHFQGRALGLRGLGEPAPVVLVPPDVGEVLERLGAAGARSALSSLGRAAPLLLDLCDPA